MDQPAALVTPAKRPREEEEQASGGSATPSTVLKKREDWRLLAGLTIQEATEEQLVDFCEGQQVRLDMPATWKIHLAPNNFTVRVLGLATATMRPGARSGDNVVTPPREVKVECIMLSQDGMGQDEHLDLSDYDATPAEKAYKETPYMQKLLVSTGQDMTLLQALAVNYPDAVTLADYAKPSVRDAERQQESGRVAISRLEQLAELARLAECARLAELERRADIAAWWRETGPRTGVGSPGGGALVSAAQAVGVVSTLTQTDIDSFAGMVRPYTPNPKSQNPYPHPSQPATALWRRADVGRGHSHTCSAGVASACWRRQKRVRCSMHVATPLEECVPLPRRGHLRGLATRRAPAPLTPHPPRHWFI